MKNIYLAGPDVFRNDASEYFKTLKVLCNKYGFNGFSPLDNDGNFNGELFSKSHGNHIFGGNVNLIRECDIIIANLVPFRGACVDDGTAWEVGYGYAIDRLIYGYTPYNKMFLKTTTYMNFDMQLQSVYPNIESFGNNSVNLMLQSSIECCGGKILDSFENCLIDLKNKYETT